MTHPTLPDVMRERETLKTVHDRLKAILDRLCPPNERYSDALYVELLVVTARNEAEMARLITTR